MGRYKVNFSNYIVLFLLTFLFSSCGGNEGHNPHDYYKNEDPQNSTLTRTNIFIDATPSIRGYANASKSIITVLIKNELVNNLKSLSENLNYYYFGDNVKKIPSSDFQSIDNPSFYTRGGKTTNIYKVIDSIAALGKNNLSVVITDLFEEQNDITKILSSISKLDLETTSIGIIGLKADFDGEIYDICFKGKKAHEKHIGLRPIYFIVFGSYVNIKDLFDKFNSNLTGSLASFDKNCIIFSKYLTENFENILIPNDSSVLKNDDAGYSISEEGSKQYLTFEPGKFSVKLTPHFLPYSMFSNVNAADYQLSEQHSCDKQSNLTNKIALKLSNPYTVDLDIKEGGYCFQALLSYKYKEENNPKWFRDWDFSIDKIVAWDENRNLNANYLCLTQNLNFFISSIAGKFDYKVGNVRFITTK